MRHQSRPKKRQRILSVIAFGIVLSLAGAYFLYDRSLQELNSNITVTDVTSALGPETARPKVVVQAAPEPDTGVRNILVLGSDQRTGMASFEDQAAMEGARADTAMLVHLSGDRKRVQVVSIPRDTVGLIPSCKTPDGGNTGPERTRFNAAFSYGGVACTIKTLEAMSDVRIDDYIVVNFNGFQQMVDALGGVKMCISQPIKDPDARVDLQAGEQTLNGAQALGFVRVRHNIGDGSDLGRIPRQQAFMSALLNQVKATNILTDLPALYRFLSAATSSLQTSPALGEVQSLAKVALSIKGIDAAKIEFETVPVVPDPDAPMQTVVLNKLKAQAMFDAIKYDRSFYAPAEGTTGTPSSGATSSPATDAAGVEPSDGSPTVTTSTSAESSSAATPTKATAQPSAIGVCGTK